MEPTGADATQISVQAHPADMHDDAVDAVADGTSMCVVGGMKASQKDLDTRLRQFLTDLVHFTFERDCNRLTVLYEKDFNELSAKLFPNMPWPHPDTVCNFLKNNDMHQSMLQCLYVELYYRHLFNKCGNHITVKDREASWLNYVILTTYFVEEECIMDLENPSESLQLPSEWAWDFVDEIISQYVEAQTWRSEFSQIDDVRHQYHPSRTVFWITSVVLDRLTALVNLSDIREYTTRYQDLNYNPSSGGVNHSERLLSKYQFGYFSMIALLRLNVLFGDFRGALKAVDSIDLTCQTAFFWRVPAATLTLFYYTGFSYIMLRRYVDAIRVYSQILTFLNKAKNYMLTDSHQKDIMMNLSDKMTHLAVKVSTIFSIRLDESFAAQLRESIFYKYQKVQLDDEEALRDIFAKSCPDFTDPTEPPEAHSAEPPKYQKYFNIFLKDIRRQRDADAVCSFAKVYNNISFQKLMSLMECKGVEDSANVRSRVLSVKNRSLRKVWQSGSLASGVNASMRLDIDFHVDNDVIYLKNYNAKKEYITYFLHEIARTQELQTQIAQQRSPATSPMPPIGTSNR